MSQIKRKRDEKILTIDVDINAASASKLLMRGQAVPVNSGAKKASKNNRSKADEEKMDRNAD